MSKPNAEEVTHEVVETTVSTDASTYSTDESVDESTVSQSASTLSTTEMTETDAYYVDDGSGSYGSADGEEYIIEDHYENFDDARNMDKTD